MPKQFKAGPSFLLINPPIYDFAAHDLWLRPLGLLYIAAMLESSGAAVELIDCLDRNHPLVPAQDSNLYGCGKYHTEVIAKPAAYKNIPRNYKRYGLSGPALKAALERVSRPDMVLVSSGMSYWYPGVQEAVASVKEIFPGAPVVLGGIYATLCPEHAERHSGADFVIPGTGLSPLSQLIKDLLKFQIDFPESFSDYPGPENRFYSKAGYAVTRTARGCPFDCSYCAQKALNSPGIQAKDPPRVIDELTVLALAGIENIAFYDDALLFKPEEHIMPILTEIVNRKLNIRFHTPNGLHSRFISPRLALLLKDSSFEMPRISLETADPLSQQRTGAKVTSSEFAHAAQCLKGAGYKPGEFIAYLMLGMPGQAPEEVENTVRFAHACGARVSLSEYSPIPGTRDWQEAAGFLLSDDPLWHNNSVFPALKPEERFEANRVKQLAVKMNKCFT